MRSIKQAIKDGRLIRQTQNGPRSMVERVAKFSGREEALPSGKVRIGVSCGPSHHNWVTIYGSKVTLPTGFVVRKA